MNDTEHIIEKVTRFIEQQKEVYGDFTVSDYDNPSAEDSTENEANQSNESEQEYKAEAKVTNSDKTEVKQPEKELSVEGKIANCTTLEELRELCEQSDELRTDLEGTNLVFGVGNHNADLMLIGEAPGYNEDQQGEPFVGKAGQLLDKILAAINFERDEVYIANILKHRPPNNRDPKPEESSRSLPFLMKQIELIDPKLILSVGRISAQTLLNTNDSLGSLRKQFHDFHGRELMVTYHPAALLRDSRWKRPTWEDVQKLRQRYDELTDD